MKKINYLLIISVLLTSCALKTSGDDGKKGAKGQSSVEITKESVQINLEYLASDDLEGRNTGTIGIEKAATYIEEFFKKNSVKPFFKTYRDSFDIKRPSNPKDNKEANNIIGYNVVGFVEGNDVNLKNEFVILGAHYDHIGLGKEVNGDTFANGANDDASGTVAVMEWARYFAKTKSNKRSILFVLFSAEEMGLKGSWHLAEKLKQQNIDLYTMINFEMIGVPRSEDVEMAYITGYDNSNMASKLNEYIGGETIGFLEKAKEFRLFQRSDNYPFYKEFENPSHAISTFDFTNFDFYHHVDDEAEKMNYDHMTEFIKKMIPAIEGMTNSESKDIKLNND